jgi:hypothetical protein
MQTNDCSRDTRIMRYRSSAGPSQSQETNITLVCGDCIAASGFPAAGAGDRNHLSTGLIMRAMSTKFQFVAAQTLTRIIVDSLLGMRCIKSKEACSKVFKPALLLTLD